MVTTNFAPTYAAHTPQISSAFQPNVLPQGYSSSGPFYSHHMPQQNIFGQKQASSFLNSNSVCHTPSPPLATMLQPTMSAITPEVFYIIFLA